MAIKQRKQLTGTTEQIKAYAGVEGQLVWNKTKKKWVGMSGTAGTNYPMASESHTHIISNVTNLQTTLDGKQAKLPAGTEGQVLTSVSGSPTWKAPKEVDVSTLIPKTGDRGVLRGYENAVESSGAQITIDSPDTMFVQTNGNYSLNFTKAGELNQTSTKVIILSAVTTTTLSIAGAEWANNADAPTWGTKDSILVLVAHFFGDYVYLSVFHNSEG